MGPLYANERRKEERDGQGVHCNGLIIHSSASREKKNKTAADTHLRRIYNWSASLGGLSSCFMTGAMRGVISAFFFYVRHLQSAKTPHFVLQRRRLMSEPWRGKVGVEVGSWIEASIQVINIYDRG